MTPKTIGTEQTWWFLPSTVVVIAMFIFVASLELGVLVVVCTLITVFRPSMFKRKKGMLNSVNFLLFYPSQAMSIFRKSPVDLSTRRRM